MKLELRLITCLLSFLPIHQFANLPIYKLAKLPNDYDESEIVLKTKTGNIYGTLSIPKNRIKTPVVLIIAGSGPTDRDGNSSVGLQTDAYKLLSIELAMSGISSVRFDKRGIGKSLPEGFSESDLRFETYVDDVVDWLNLLKADSRFSKIYIIGHSEGSLIGMLAAEKVNVSGFISLAGAGRTADKLIMEQVKAQPQYVIDETKSILESLLKGETVSNMSSYMEALFRPSVQPYIISWLKYDPAIEIKKLTVPVIILQGTTDIQISIEDAKLLAAAKPDATFILINNMNHILKKSGADRDENLATYNKPELPVKKELVDAILNFVH